MKLPELKDTTKYAGLYVVDFGDSSSVGFTADEVAELLESERFSHIKVYKIHSARPDGTLELKGIPAETFQLEMGMFFVAHDEETASQDFSRLVNLAVTSDVPARAKAHLARMEQDQFVTALIFPAEYNEEFSRWLSEGNYKTAGPAYGGIDAVRDYYDRNPEILHRHQFIPQSGIVSRTGNQLLTATRLAVQR